MGGRFEWVCAAKPALGRAGGCGRPGQCALRPAGLRGGAGGLYRGGGPAAGFAGGGLQPGCHSLCLGRLWRGGAALPAGRPDGARIWSWWQQPGTTSATVSSSRAWRNARATCRQALSALQASVAFYQGALELTPHDREAARNIEVVRLAIKDILDQLQDQLQEQQAENEVAEQLRDLQQRQQEAAARSAQLANDPPPEAARSEALRQLRQEQQQITEQTAAAAQQLDEQAGSAQPSGNAVTIRCSGGRQRAPPGSHCKSCKTRRASKRRPRDRLEGQEPQSAHQPTSAPRPRTLRRRCGHCVIPTTRERPVLRRSSPSSRSNRRPPRRMPRRRKSWTKNGRDRAAREQLQRGTLPRTLPVEKNW